MKQKKQITHWLSVIVIGIALGLGLQFVRAWTEPTEAPPNGNVGAPINTGSNPQTKAGNLNVNGGILVGSSTPGGNMGTGAVNADQVCIRGVCQTTWPSGGGGIPTVFCGNGTCDTGETCSSCAADCGACPCECGINTGPGIMEYWNCGATTTTDYVMCTYEFSGTQYFPCYSTCASPGVWIALQCNCP